MKSVFVLLLFFSLTSIQALAAGTIGSTLFLTNYYRGYCK